MFCDCKPAKNTPEDIIYRSAENVYPRTSKVVNTKAATLSTRTPLSSYQPSVSSNAGYQSLTTIPVKHTGYVSSLHSKAYSLTTIEVVRDLPPTQVRIHHVPSHVEYTHVYKKATEITEADKLSAKQVGYQAAMHQKAFSATAEEVARDLPPTQVKIHHVPSHVEYSHQYDYANTVSEEDIASAKQVGYQAAMHQKAFSATTEEVARDLPPTQVKIHHVPSHLEYSHQYDFANTVSEEDKLSAIQVGYKAAMHQKAFSATTDEVARDLPPTQVKVHHVPSHFEYSHQYDHASFIPGDLVSTSDETEKAVLDSPSISTNIKIRRQAQETQRLENDANIVESMTSSLEEDRIIMDSMLLTKKRFSQKDIDN